GHRTCHGIPRHHRRGPHQSAERRRRGSRNETRDGRIPSGPRTERRKMTSAAPTGAKTGVAAAASSTKTGKSRLRPSYWPFVLPALITVGAVIVFPWVFTLWMSTNQWQLGGEQSFVGFDNYLRLAADMRFWESMWHTV